MTEQLKVMGLSRLLSAMAARLESGVGELNREFLEECAKKTALLEHIAETATVTIAGSGHAKTPAKMVVDVNALLTLRTALMKAGYLV